jgi:signal-transduction protein with cAMP-binding, CBS, and nucleotidyltransferase domain
MVGNRIRHLLVTDKEDKKPIGIVSATDIVEYVRENRSPDAGRQGRYQSAAKRMEILLLIFAQCKEHW